MMRGAITGAGAEGATGAGAGAGAGEGARQTDDDDDEASDDGGDAGEDVAEEDWVNPPPPATTRSFLHDAHHGGFIILSNVITEAHALQACAHTPEWEPLFGAKPKGWEEDKDNTVSIRTSKRFAAQVSARLSWARGVIDAVRAVLEKKNIIGKKHFVDAVTLLLAKDGAPRQGWHADFVTHGADAQLYKLPRYSDGTVPYPVSVMIAIEENTTLDVKKTSKPAQRISIPRLGVVVFRGDLRHAGSPYEMDHKRMHIYFGIKHKGETGKVKKVGAPRNGSTLTVALFT